MLDRTNNNGKEIVVVDIDAAAPIPSLGKSERHFQKNTLQYLEIYQENIDTAENNFSCPVSCFRQLLDELQTLTGTKRTLLSISTWIYDGQGRKACEEG